MRPVETGGRTAGDPAPETRVRRGWNRMLELSDCKFDSFHDHPDPAFFTRTLGGAEGIRTPDLRSAIAALSHLSYSPVEAPAL